MPNPVKTPVQLSRGDVTPFYVVLDDATAVAGGQAAGGVQAYVQHRGDGSIETRQWDKGPGHEFPVEIIGNVLDGVAEDAPIRSNPNMMWGRANELWYEDGPRQ